MTINYILRLNNTLIQPGHIDKKVKLKLTNKEIMTNLFCFVFKPIEGDVTPLKNAQSDVLVREDRKVYEATRSQEEEVSRVEQLVKEFTTRVLELKFSLAEILSFLLEYRKSLGETIDNVEQLISKPIKVKSKTSRISKDTKPKGT